MIQMKLKEYNFNSQPHEEADCMGEAQIERDDISTHSLTRRLTFFLARFLSAITFQLTASRGG